MDEIKRFEDLTSLQFDVFICILAHYKAYPLSDGIAFTESARREAASQLEQWGFITATWEGYLPTLRAFNMWEDRRFDRQQPASGAG